MINPFKLFKGQLYITSTHFLAPNYHPFLGKTSENQMKLLSFISKKWSCYFLDEAFFVRHVASRLLPWRPHSTQDAWSASLCCPFMPSISPCLPAFTREGGKADESGTQAPGQFCPRLLRKSSNFCETEFPSLSVEMLSITSRVIVKLQWDAGCTGCDMPRIMTLLSCDSSIEVRSLLMAPCVQTDSSEQ